MILLGLWGAFGVLATIRDNFIPVEYRQAWDTIRLIPKWDLTAWVLVFVLIVLVGLFEGSFRLRRELDGRLQETHEALEVYRSGDPRIEIIRLELDDVNPYRVVVGVTIENPGAPTILRSWEFELSTGGNELPGRLWRTDDWVCTSSGQTRESGPWTIPAHRFLAAGSHRPVSYAS